jgi:hypothetical protein
MLGPENPETLRSRWDLQIAWSWYKTADALIEVPANIETSRKVLGPEDRETLAQPCWRRQ